jgi:hypothetical protein
MSDGFQMLVDVDATPREAEGVSRTVLARFRKLGLITGRANRDCALGGSGFRPGGAVAKLYKAEIGEYQFWKLHTCGVEPKVGRGFNAWALGPSCEGFKCPACGAEFAASQWPSTFNAALSEWMGESGPALVRCPKCRK